MKILMIGRAYPDEKTGMMGIFEFEQAKALSENGCEAVYAFCDTRSIKKLRKYGHFEKQTSNVNVYGHHLPIGGLPQKAFSKIKLHYFKKTINEIKEKHGEPDIIHIHFPLLNLTAEIWEELKSLQRPIVVTEHWSKVQTKNLEPFRLKLLQRIVDESDEFICVGELLKKSILELTNTDREIKVIPNMVSSLFRYAESKGNLNTYEFLAVGRLVELKRFELVIDAFEKTFKKNKNVKLTIVGGGPLYDNLQRRISDLEMQDQITLTGYLSRTETAKRMQQTNAYVSASVLETFGVPFVEALVSGKPVIGVEDNPIAPYIDDSNGILVKPDDVQSIANALTVMYDNREKFNGKKIADLAQQHFGEKALVEQLKAIYADCMRE